jgi:hypothetical protein
MKAIEDELDLENGVSVTAGEALLAETRAALEDYNSSLAVSDEKLNVFNAKDRQLCAYNKKILPAVGLKFGTDSNQYEQVGGIRESERRKPVRKGKETEG